MKRSSLKSGFFNRIKFKPFLRVCDVALEIYFKISRVEIEFLRHSTTFFIPF